MANRMTLEDFIVKSKIKHGEKYDYSKSEYVNSRTKLVIICPFHGEFLQTPTDHYLCGCGCPECDPTKRIGTEKFIEISKNIHGEKYDYSLVEYGKNNYEPVIIKCNLHGIFKQKPWAHMRGQGCSECAGNKRSTTLDFIEKSKLKHGDLYDYSLVEYITKRIPVRIICKLHGFFEQKPSVHLDGHGCSICNNSKLELYFRKKLIELGIKFEQNKKFKDCRNVYPLSFDFYLLESNCLVELDGIQHFKPVQRFGGVDRFKMQKKLDGIKNNYCLENNIRLVRLTKIKDIDEFFSQKI